jgi:hypothetical protein
MKQLLFLLLTTFSLSAQIKGVVKDSISGKPIAYVNIWIENENIGTTSEKNGSFLLDIKEEKNIVFSALGYETKILKSSQIDKVSLIEKIYEMPEIVLEIPQLTKEIEVGDSKKIHHTQLSGDKPWIYGKSFKYEEKFTETPFLKSIIFYTNSNIKDAKLKIRVFEMKDSIPADDILYEDIIVTVKKGMKKNKLDVSKYNINFPKDGLLVGLEWLIIDENKYDFVYTIKKQKKSFVTYAPSLVINYFDEENSFSYTGGKWVKNFRRKSNDGRDWDNKIMTPAINIVLSN